MAGSHHHNDQIQHEAPKCMLEDVHEAVNEPSSRMLCRNARNTDFSQLLKLSQTPISVSDNCIAIIGDCGKPHFSCKRAHGEQIGARRREFELPRHQATIIQNLIGGPGFEGCFASQIHCCVPWSEAVENKQSVVQRPMIHTLMQGKASEQNAIFDMLNA